MTKTDIELLTPEQWQSLRNLADHAQEILEEWPRVKAAAGRKTWVDWYNGVIARNPKLSSALSLAAGAALAALTAWMAGLVTLRPEPAPVAPVPSVAVPAEKAETKAPAKAKPKPKPVMPAAPVSSHGGQTHGNELAASLRGLDANTELLPVLQAAYAEMAAEAHKFGSVKELLTATEARSQLAVGGELPGVRAAIAKELEAAPDVQACALRLSEVSAALQALIDDGPRATQAGAATEQMDEPPEDEPTGWTVWRKLPPGWADGPKQHAATNASERKVK